MKIFIYENIVADCCALFSMNQTMSIPVDTHVLQIAQRDYAAESIIKKYHKSINKPTPSSITPVVYEIIGDIFRVSYYSTKTIKTLSFFLSLCSFLLALY